jgi:4,5-dihydroxyphthalate decarboxylase
MIELRTAIASYPHVLALKNGIVGSGRLRLGHEEVEPITRAFRRMVRTMDFDVCEIALTTLAQARDYGKPLTALPVVLMRGFHHAALVCPVGSRLRGPADLLGKRIGVRAFSQTTGVWVRGILLEEYGVDHRDITWVTGEDAHVLEYRDPPNVVRIAPGRDLSTMLLSGEIDAAVALTRVDPTLVRTVIPDAAAAAAAWFRKIGAYPVNHVVCVRSGLLDEHPWLAAELMRMFRDAKAAAPAASAEAEYAPLVGDPLPYGLDANRAGIEFCLRHAAEQALVDTVCRPEDLFVTA